MTEQWAAAHRISAADYQARFGRRPFRDLRYNTSIAALMQLVNAVRADNVCHKFVRAVG